MDDGNFLKNTGQDKRVNDERRHEECDNSSRCEEQDDDNYSTHDCFHTSTFAARESVLSGNIMCIW